MNINPSHRFIWPTLLIIWGLALSNSHAETTAQKQAKPEVTVRKSSKHGKGITPSSNSQEDMEDDYANIKHIPDPIEPVNRGTFWFNHQLYHYAFKPLTKVYKIAFPQKVRTGVSNVVYNAQYPCRVINDMLQWKPKTAGLETEKFLVNTTAGVGGIFRVSDKIPALSNIPSTDTSITFAKWGIPNGCYVVWPILGPYSVRDTVGFAGDIAMDPITWPTLGAGSFGTLSIATTTPRVTSKGTDQMDNYDTLTHGAVDRYSAVRSAYEQNHKMQEQR
jgi:phospholipid-binding lipoprotein MlaA